MGSNFDEDTLIEIKSQYKTLMEMSEVEFPDTPQYLLHVCVIDWLNKEFNSNYDTENLESINKMKLERFTGDEFEGLEIV